jgi:micrococcal nuclease
VRLEYDVSRYDQYGRTLAYVYLKDGTFVNADLVKKGYATVMTIPPNVKYADTFLKLSKKARNQGKGLWKENPAEK